MNGSEQLHLLLAGWGQSYVFGVGTGSGVNIPCWRDFYVGVAGVWLDDWANPYISSVSGMPAGWISSSTPMNPQATAHDAGLGVQFVTVTQDGKGVIAQDQVGCTGVYSSRCPTIRDSALGFTALSLGEGIRNLYFTTQDPTGKGSGSWVHPTMVDLTKPEVTLSGQLAQATNEGGAQERPPGDGDELSLPVYNLKISATDGNPAGEPKDKRSGVKDIKIFLDDEEVEVPWSGQGCGGPNYSCPMNKSYSLVLTDVEVGEHTLKVRVVDHAGNYRDRNIEFEYFPATGMKDEYVMHHFPLSDGSGEEEEGEGAPSDPPELAVNVMNGNLLYRETDIDIEGSAPLDLEIERYYNSMLPESKDSGWGDGWTVADVPDLTPRDSDLPLAAIATIGEEPEVNEHGFALWLDMPDPSGDREGYALGFERVLAGVFDVTLSRWDEGVETVLASEPGFALDPGDSLALVDEGSTVSAWTDTGSGFALLISGDDSAFEEGSAGLEGVGDDVRLTDFRSGALEPPSGGIADQLASLPVTEAFDGGEASLGRFQDDWLALGWAAGESPKGADTPAGWGPVDAFPEVSGAYLDSTMFGYDGVLDEAEMVDETGSVEPGVELPAEAGLEAFDPELQATVKKKSTGGYLPTDDTGESMAATSFNEAGRAEAMVTESDVKVDFEYQGGELSRIDVEDPGSAGNPTEEPEEAEEEPQMTNPTPVFSSAFGSKGTGHGQLDTPGDLAVDPQGHIWVVDTQNKRVQEFAPDGEFLSKFGSPGSGPGQFNAPTGIAIDPEGDLWVTDAENDRVQKFSPDGEYLDALGSTGSGDGELDRPEGIALDDEGNLWVADSDNGRLQAFDSEGEFIRVVGSKGSGEGQLGQPAGVEVGPEGNLWVADPQNQRVAVFEPDGEFLLQFGAEGNGDGEFEEPAVVDVDERGNVWVADQGNARIQRFDISGEYVDQFGSPGSGEGQLDLSRPMGIFATGAGRVLISDSHNDRVQAWALPEAEPGESEALPDDDPAVDVEVSEGLVTGVEGEEAGEHSYEHEGDDLVAHEGPEGTTEYEYDGEGRMTKVTLADETVGEISYQSDGRVESVTIDPTGEEPARTTDFNYSDDPRRTTVFPPGDPHIVYDIGDDGSVFKWWNTKEPPELNLLGTLYDNKEEDGKLIAGDHLLKAESFSPEGVAAIEVIAGGETLVDEKHCEQDEETEELECVNPPPFLEWVMETGSNPPGHLSIEVIATDRLGESTSERFWVDVPETPPLAPGTPVPPTFSQIAKFREDYGLEINFPVEDETELNERIFDLITAWWNPQTPAGKVARASHERWGVPMRAADVAELEYREWYLTINAKILDQWFEASKPATYAGFYLDHRAGGVMNIGFVESQQESLEAVQGALPLTAEERLAVFPDQPTVSLVALDAASDAIFESLSTNESLDATMTDARVDMGTNSVQLTAQSLPVAEAGVASVLGTNAPVTFNHDANVPQLASGRFRDEGRMRAGDFIFSRTANCTAGFGAYRKRKSARTGGPKPDINYVLTAGHCYDGTLLDSVFYRSTRTDRGPENQWDDIGVVALDAYHGGSGVRADAAAIELDNPKQVPRKIFTGTNQPWGVRPAEQAFVGDRLCFSGKTSQNPNPCGEVIGRSKGVKSDDGRRHRGYWVEFDREARPGDSGAPVFKQTGAAVGILIIAGGVTVELGPIKFELSRMALVEPLLHPPNMRKNWVPGILHEESMAPLYIRTGPSP